MIADARALALHDALTQEHREYWNHWRQVEEKVMEDEELAYAYYISFS